MRFFIETKPSTNAFLDKSGEVAVCIDWVDKQAQIGSITIDGYECTRIDFRPTMLNTDNVIEQFVREKYSQSEEFALINSYNASISGIAKDANKEAEYLDFLSWRNNMKEQVKAAISSFDSATIPTTQE